MPSSIVPLDPALASLSSAFSVNPSAASKAKGKGKERAKEPDLQVSDTNVDPSPGQEQQEQHEEGLDQLHEPQLSDTDFQLLLPHLQAAASPSVNDSPCASSSLFPPHLSDPQLTPLPESSQARETKRHWLPAEDAHLLALVAENGPRNWASVAKELGTGRTAPSCCARWCRLAGGKVGVDAKDEGGMEGVEGVDIELGGGGGELSVNGDEFATNGGGGEEGQETGGKDKGKKKEAYKAIAKGPRTKWCKWTPEEDADLRALVAQHGAKNWALISSLMKTIRSDDSCCGRWTHYLQPKTMKVVDEEGREREVPTPKSNANAANPRWTHAEDLVLKAFKLANPSASWNTVGENMDPKRSAGSCRARWVQHVVKLLEQDELDGMEEKQQIAIKVAIQVKKEKEDKQHLAQQQRLAATSAAASSGPYTGGQYKDPSQAPPIPIASPSRSTPTPSSSIHVHHQPHHLTHHHMDQSTSDHHIPTEEENLHALRSILDPTLMSSLAQSGLIGVGAGVGDEESDGDGLAGDEALMELGENGKQHVIIGNGKGKNALGKKKNTVKRLATQALMAQAAAAHQHRADQTQGDAVASTSAAPSAAEQAHIDPNLDGNTEESNNELDLSYHADAAAHQSDGAKPSGASRPWAPEEEARMMELVAQYGRRGWVKIAEMLGTGRTAASASARWHRVTSTSGSAAQDINAVIASATSTAINESTREDNDDSDDRAQSPDASTSTPVHAAAPLTKGRQGGKKMSWKAWTPEDDLELRANVAKYGRNSWKLVGAEMTNPRTEYATSSRWYEHLAKADIAAAAAAAAENGEDGDAPKETILAVKRRWTNEEDTELRALVAAHGPAGWNEIGKLMTSGRPGTSCRLRWFNYLCKTDPPAIEIETNEEHHQIDDGEMHDDPAASAPTFTPTADQQLRFNEMLAAGSRANIDGENVNVDLSTILALLPAHAAAQANESDEIDVPAAFEAAVLGGKRAVEDGETPAVKRSRR